MQGFLKNLYKFIGLQLKYKSTIMNQFENIDDFYKIFWFTNPSHF
jgi:hypothetical protein